MVFRGRLSPEEMFPAGHPELRVYFARLASGLRVRVVEAGNVDSPSVLFLPGWGCSTYVFRETLGPIAAAGYRAIAVDLQGHGLSDKPESAASYTLASMRGHVIDILDTLGLYQVRLAGLSMGAALAAHVAAELPERVLKVVLVSTVGFDGVPGLNLFQSTTPASAIPILPRIATRAVLRIMLNGVYGKLRPFTARDVDEYWAPTQFPGFTRAMRHLLHEFPWTAAFPMLTMPCLVITGASDHLARRGTVEARVRVCPSMELMVVPGAGHVVFDEAPDLVNSAMVDFFRADGVKAYISTQNDTS